MLGAEAEQRQRLGCSGCDEAVELGVECGDLLVEGLDASSNTAQSELCCLGGSVGQRGHRGIDQRARTTPPASSPRSLTVGTLRRGTQCSDDSRVSDRSHLAGITTNPTRPMDHSGSAEPADARLPDDHGFRFLVRDGAGQLTRSFDAVLTSRGCPHRGAWIGQGRSNSDSRALGKRRPRRTRAGRWPSIRAQGRRDGFSEPSRVTSSDLCEGTLPFICCNHRVRRRSPSQPLPGK